MELAFNKVKRLSKQRQEASRLLDQRINEEYGFSYSETDDDQIIDTLDYATSDISFKEFTERMQTYKKNLEKDGRFGCIP